MKIGASTLANKNEKINLNFYEDLGLKYVELLHQFPNENIDTKSNNLKYSIHSPFLDINIASLNETIRKASVNDIINSMDFASKINAEIVVVHPGIIPFIAKGLENKIYEKSIKSMKELKLYSDETGVEIAIENMPNIEVFIYQNINDLNNILEELELAMTLDIGHANTLNYAPNEMYFPSIKHIHMSDNFADDDNHLAFGEGSIDLKACVNIFEEQKYKGIYMIEVNDEFSVKKSYEYFKNKII